MKYPVVYSYKRSETRELELSLESLKNLKEWDGNVFIIGDKPNIKGNYIHLPIRYKWGKESGIKSNDEVCAYLTAADYLDEFIAMADDIYILKPWSLESFNKGTIQEHIESRKREDSYARQLKATKMYLEYFKKSTLSYELHIPFLMTAKDVRRAEIMIDVGGPMLIRSLIGNWNKIDCSLSDDVKNVPITDETVLYSSTDSTFDYEKVKRFLV